MSPNLLLKHLKTFMIITGTWPLRSPNRFLMICYTTYSFLFQGHYVLFIVTLLIGFLDLLNESSLERSECLGYILLHLFIYWKTIVSQTKGIRTLLDNVAKTEEQILNRSDDEGKKLVYTENVKYIYKMYKVIFLVSFIAVNAFWLSAAYVLIASWSEEAELLKLNVTDYRRPLQIYEWFPFDMKKHYYVGYAFQITASTTAACFYSAGDCLFITLIVFSIGQLKILRYSFGNIGKYLTNDDSEAYEVIRKLVQEHEDVIKFVKNLDKSMRSYMFGDFLVRSYYISLILYQLMTVKIGIGSAFSMMHLTLMLSQMLYIYFHANQLQIDSMAISLGILESKWYEQSKKVQKSMLIILMRASNPLQMHIGPLYDISNKIIIKTLKAAYTYILFNQV